jgi:hypothetical protein
MKFENDADKLKAVLVETIRRAKESNSLEIDDRSKRTFSETYFQDKSEILKDLGLNGNLMGNFHATDWRVDRALGKAQILDMISISPELKILKDRIAFGVIVVDGTTEQFPTVKFESAKCFTKSQGDSILDLIPSCGGSGSDSLLGKGADVIVKHNFGKQDVFAPDLKSGLLEAQGIVESFEKTFGVDAKPTKKSKLKM